MLLTIDNDVRKQPPSNTTGVGFNSCNIYRKQIFSINENL